MTLLPSIADSVLVFIDHLDNVASSGETLPLQNAATNLTFDVIGKMALDVNMVSLQTLTPVTVEIPD